MHNTFNRLHCLRKGMREEPEHQLVPFKLETLDLLVYRDPYKVPSLVQGEVGGHEYKIEVTEKPLPENKDSITYKCPGAEDPAMNQFLKAFVEAMVFFDTFDVYAPNPTRQFDKLVDDFLMQHTGKTYEEFRRGAHAYSIDRNDYGKVAKKGLRGKLFRYRSKLYLSALAAVTAKGVELERILDQVHDAVILPIKKEKDEPTFEYIREFLRAHSE